MSKHTSRGRAAPLETAAVWTFATSAATRPPPLPTSATAKEAEAEAALSSGKSQSCRTASRRQEGLDWSWVNSASGLDWRARWETPCAKVPSLEPEDQKRKNKSQVGLVELGFPKRPTPLGSSSSLRPQLPLRTRASRRHGDFSEPNLRTFSGKLMARLGGVQVAKNYTFGGQPGQTKNRTLEEPPELLLQISGLA